MARDGDVSDRGWRGEVLEIERMSPSLIRVELGGPGLADFASLGVPDEACVFEFPVPGAASGLVPDPGRWYTVHHYEAGRMTVGIVLHPGGLGSGWAQAATVGDTLRITHHNSWYRRPGDARWQLLLGDITALPAIARMVGEAAETVPTSVVVEIPDAADAVELSGADVRWVHNPALGAGSVLGEVARELALPEGPGYVYVAGEAAATRAVRKFLRQELRLPSDRYGVIGYWRRNREDWERRQRESGVDIGELYAQAQAAGQDEEEVRDLYERRLAEVGLL